MVLKRKPPGFSFPENGAVPDVCKPNPDQRFSNPELLWDQQSQPEYLH